MDIAVVIPTRGLRERRLAAALESLAAQTLAHDRFEVVVVRDPDAAGPFASAPDGLRTRFLTSPRPKRVAANRNLGWRSTAAPLVAFTDDDCRPEPGWLEAIVAAGDGPATVVQGQTIPDPDERHDHWGLAHSQLIEGPSPWYETCNIAYPLGLLERLGGFDEAFPGDGGEDTDLGLRAEDRGARRVYAGEAVVRHGVLTLSVAEAVRRAVRYSDLPRLFALHPRQRSALRYGLFLRESHARLALAAAGVATRRPLLAAAAAAPYVSLHLDSYARTVRGRARGLLDLPARALVDGAETAAIIRGAVRHSVPIA